PDYTNTVCIEFLEVQFSIFNGFIGRDQSIMNKRIKFASFLLAEKVIDIKVLYFAGKTRLKFTCIKMSDWSGAAYSIDKTVPVFRDSISNWGKRTEPSYNYSFKLHV